MKRIILCMFALIAVLSANAITVTITVDEGFDNPAILQKMETNLGQVLTEINEAYYGKRDINTSSLQMDNHAKNMLVTLWSTVHFYCDDEEVVDRCWPLQKSYLLRQIPLILEPQDESFTSGTYQEAVIEFDKTGKIIDFRFALDAQLSESMERCGSVVETERRLIILDYIEQFRTAYCTKDSNFLEKIFSDDAVIITGKVIRTRPNNYKTTFTPQTKQEYLRNLKRAFRRNKYIDVKFSEIGSEESEGGCPGITRSQNNPNFYGVRLFQEWRSSSYSDEGYVFLLWNFTNESEPVIEVRTWQPSYITTENGQKQPLSGEDIFNMSSVEDMIK